MKRLSQSSGSVVADAPVTAESENRFVKPAILVHSGPEGTPMVFMSGDGEIAFDEKRIQRVVNNQNAKMQLLANEYGGLDKMPPGAWTPILDQHEDESNDRKRGRLASLLRFERRDVPGVGKNVACAVADIEFLGKDTVEKVKDGRIYHLSIGIDENTDTLGEVSTVIEPAAPGAMLLSKGGSKTTKKGEPQMSDKIKRMTAHKDRFAKLSAISGTLTELKAKLVKTSENVKLTRKEGEVSHRLSGLMKAGKMMPSEMKNLQEKVGLKKLAAMKQEDLDIALAVYDTREKPVIDPKQHGASDGTEVTKLTKELGERNRKRLFRSEIAKDFKRLTGKKMAFGDDAAADDEHGKDKEMAGGNKEHAVDPAKDGHAVPGQAGDEKQLAHHMAALAKHLEAGDVEEAKKSHAEMAKCMSSEEEVKHMEMGDVKSEDYRKSMDAHQGQIDELNTNMARLAGMVEELMSAEKEEGHELEAAGEEDNHDDKATA